MEKNNFLKIIIIPIVLIGLVGAGYFFIQSKKEREQEDKTEQKRETVDETSDWKTYRNEKYGFEFKYPSKIIGKQVEIKEINGKIESGSYFLFGSSVPIPEHDEPLGSNITFFVQDLRNDAVRANVGIGKCGGEGGYFYDKKLNKWIINIDSYISPDDQLTWAEFFDSLASYASSVNLTVVKTPSGHSAFPYSYNNPNYPNLTQSNCYQHNEQLDYYIFDEQKLIFIEFEYNYQKSIPAVLYFGEVSIPDTVYKTAESESKEIKKILDQVVKTVKFTD